MNDAERLRHIEDFGAMLDRAVAAEAERDTLAERLERIREQASRYWRDTNGEHWLDGGIHHKPGTNLGHCQLCFDGDKS